MATVRTNTYAVNLNGVHLDNVQSFSYTLSYEDPVGKAQVKLAGWTAGHQIISLNDLPGTYFDDVTIVVNGDPRWSGVLLQWDFSLFPRTITMQCKGRLEYANRYKLPLEHVRKEDKGLLLEDFVTGTATDQNIVQSVLDYIGLSTNNGSIAGTGRTYGTIANQEFAWAVNETALSYIQKIDGVSAGYRTFESAGGSIFRTSVSPATAIAAGASLFFTEGEDIREASSSRTVEKAYNYVRVEGYSVGDYLEPRVWVEPGSNAFMSTANPRTFSFSSPMIERRAESSAGQGMSCESMAQYWSTELNREIVQVQMTTPRADVIGPAQIHLVQGPGGQAYRLGVGENLWVQGVTGTLDESGAFSQTMQYVGGNL